MEYAPKHSCVDLGRRGGATIPYPTLLFPSLLYPTLPCPTPLYPTLPYPTQPHTSPARSHPAGLDETRIGEDSRGNCPIYLRIAYRRDQLPYVPTDGLP